MEPTVCPYCKNSTQPNFIYCPTCGKNLMEASTPIPLSKQIGVYALSILLPPLGLWPGIKYLVSKNPNGKQVGIIAIILTAVAIIIGIFAVMQFMSMLSQSVNLQLDNYQNLGI